MKCRKRRDDIKTRGESLTWDKSKGQNPKDESTDAENRGGATRNSEEVPVMGIERRG